MNKKILLTSAGFENINIKNKFISYLKKDIDDVKVLFVITAANNPVAVRYLSKCLNDLSNCNIKDENIFVYDMHKKIKLSEYDAIYVCGGNTDYLVERMQEINFKETLDEYLNNGGIYVGVSAGTLASSGNYKNGLNLIENKVNVHCEIGSKTIEQEIYLTDNQCICIENDKKYILE